MERLIEMIKKFIKDNKLLITLYMLSIPLIFSLFFFFGHKFEMTLDQQSQFDVFYYEWINMLRNFKNTGELPFWSWNNFLGTNFLASKSFYLIADPFIIFIYFMQDNIHTALLIETIFIIIISGLLFNAYLQTISINNIQLRNVLAFVYSLAGTSILFIGNYKYHRFYMFLPLLFIGVERYIQNKEYRFFILGVAALFLTSYYFMFPTSIIMALYIIYSHITYNQKVNIKNIIVDAIKMFGAYVIGLLISAIVVIPGIMFLLSNTRIGNTGQFSMFWDSRAMLGFLFSNFTSPFNLFSDLPYIFYSGDNGHGHWFSVYTSALTPIILIASFFIKDRFTKRTSIIFYISMLCFVLFQPLSSLIHGFSEPSLRWTFIFTFMNLMFVAKFLDTMNLEEYSWFKIFGISSSLIILGTIYGVLTGIINIEVHIIHLSATYLYLLLGFIYALLLNKKLYRFIYIVIILEIILSSMLFMYVYRRNHNDADLIINPEYIEYFNYELDNGVYTRQYIAPELLSSYPINYYNYPMYYGYSQATMYDTAYQPKLIDFLNWNGFNWHIVDIKNFEVLHMLGTKYFGTIDGTDLPTEGTFTYSHDINHIHMYKLEDYNMIAHTYSHFLPYSQFEGEMNIDMDWNNELIIDSELEKLVKDVQPSDKSQIYGFWNTGNSFYGKVETALDQVLFVSIPYSDGWIAIVNGEEVDIHNVQGGFMGIILPAGISDIEFHFMSPGFKLGTISTLLGLLILGIIWVIESKRG